MERDSFKNRLKIALNARKMKPVDLANKLNINRAIVSQYINGRYQPNQKRIFDLAKVLNVNEAWLMGFDVPMEKTNRENKEVKIRDDIKLVFEDDVELTNEDIDFIKTFIDTKMKQNKK